jgi:hypothetical protein
LLARADFDCSGAPPIYDKLCSFRAGFMRNIELLERRMLLAVGVVEPQPAARPVSNTGGGFFVSGGKVYDANGYRFDIRGINHTTWWGNNANNLAAIDEFPKTGANAVRVVFGTGFGISSTPAQRKTIVEKLIGKGLIPIVEDHTATSGTDGASLQTVVDRWLLPDNKAWLKQYERQVILNIANEWGPDSTVWRDQYELAIDKLRAAGVNNMLVIDSAIAGIDPRSNQPGSGQSAHALETWGKELIDHDPQHNVVLSIHMYGFWRTEDRAAEVGSYDSTLGTPWDVATEMAKMKSAGLPVICGEFSWQGAANDGVPYQTRRAMEIFDQQQMGWIAWSWNQNSDPGLNMVNGYQYNSDADLTDFGKLIVNDSTYGLKKTGVQASVFQSRVRGVAFNDVDRDGVKDSGEAALAGATAFLDANSNGTLDSNERYVTTDGSGAYAFGRLASGTYVIRVTPPADASPWQSTRVGGAVANVMVTAGQNIDNVNFGFAKASAQQTPFKGTPFVVPASGSVTIQVEDFDNGGEGVAYHDVESANLGGAGYRSGTGVDLQTTSDTGGGYNLGYVKAGEWLEYTLHVDAAGTYTMDLRVAAATSNGKFHAEIDGADVTGALTMLNTGGWQTWKTLSRSGVSLAAGDHVLRLKMDANGASGSVGNFNWIKLTAAGSTETTTIVNTTSAYVQDGANANTNFGSATQLLLKKSTSGYNRESYLKFDLSGVSTISSAKLRLFGNVSDASSVALALFGSGNTSWSESTVTWNTKPVTGSQIGSATISGSTAKWYEIDLTSYLKAEKAAGHALVTIVIKSNTSSTGPYVAFNSDDAASNRPELTITS